MHQIKEIAIMFLLSLVKIAKTLTNKIFSIMGRIVSLCLLVPDLSPSKMEHGSTKYISDILIIIFYFM